MNMHNPPPPSRILRDDILPEFGLSISEAARQLGVGRLTLSNVLREKNGISPEMAIRLEEWLGEANGGRASFWLNMQAQYDLWAARQKWRKAKKVVKPFSPVLA